MKVAAVASALPVLALLPGGVIGGFLDKRAALECNTIYGTANGKKVQTNTRVNKEARTVMPTTRVRHTVFVNPTVSRTLSGSTTITERVTFTRTGSSRTQTVTDSTTSTVATQAGFTPAASAVAASRAKARRDAAPEAEAQNKKKVAVRVECTRNLGKQVTRTVTQTIKPYVTKYNAAKTVTVNRQKTQTRLRTVATTTTHPTVTVHKALATAYAACQADNLLGWTYGGSNSTLNSTSTNSQVGINAVVLASGTTPQVFDAISAQACCIRCQTTPGCVGSQYREGVCGIHTRRQNAGACASDSFVLGSFFANPGLSLGVDAGLILSNGQCGSSWKSGGFKA